MAEITVVTTSWRLLDTNVFGVHAGACYPNAYPADHQWTAVKHFTLWLTALLCHISLCRGHVVCPHKAVLQCIVMVKSWTFVFTFTWRIVYDSACYPICVELDFAASYTNTINSTRFYTHQICDYMLPSILLLWDFLSLAPCRPTFHISQHAAK